MFNLFKKKAVPEPIKEAGADYSTIKVDMHSHVLPGIDDGAQTPEDSIALIKKMMEAGITRIIATPHIMVDYYKNNAETIGASLDILRAALTAEGIDITVTAAAEHYFDENFETLIDTRKLMTMGDNFVLFEIPTLGKPPHLVQMISKMMQGGYKPILAHPERYPYLTLDDYTNLKNYGCRLQINTISLVGYYGKTIKKTAEELVDNNLVDFISSDMHHLRHAVAFQDALSMPYIQKLLTSQVLRNRILD